MRKHSAFESARSYDCTERCHRFDGFPERTYSSARSEHSLAKREVPGSNPGTSVAGGRVRGLARSRRLPDAEESSGSNPLALTCGAVRYIAVRERGDVVARFEGWILVTDGRIAPVCFAPR